MFRRPRGKLSETQALQIHDSRISETLFQVTLVVSIDEEFFGECDIVVDTHKDGTLKELVDVAMRASDGTEDVGTGVTRLRFDASLE